MTFCQKCEKLSEHIMSVTTLLANIYFLNWQMYERKLNEIEQKVDETNFSVFISINFCIYFRQGHKEIQ
jgi:hypothetical protein